ncbi:MAG: c-type cytochrome [Pseudomonadota bacterium]
MYRKRSFAGTLALLFALCVSEGPHVFAASYTLSGNAGVAKKIDANAGQVISSIPDTLKQRLVACTACHGPEGRATPEGYFPRIAGKPAGYLYHQLINFREGRRTSPMMSYMVKHLSDDYLKEMADYFSNQHIAYAPVEPSRLSSEILAKGQKLVKFGDASRQIPACAACHGEALMGVAPDIPGLLGLPRDYLRAQLSSWSNGLRRTVAPDCMAKIARQLTGDDMYAVTAWLASQSIPQDRLDVSTTALKLPIPCGSVR